MDSEVLADISDCKVGCGFWYKLTGECKRPNDVDCPKGVKRPRQLVADTDFQVLC